MANGPAAAAHWATVLLIDKGTESPPESDHWCCCHRLRDPRTPLFGAFAGLGSLISRLVRLRRLRLFKPNRLADCLFSYDRGRPMPPCA